MRALKIILLLAAIVTSPVWSAPQNPGAEEDIRELVINWLKKSTAFISCDQNHFIYGVGYIDGSYMERIFYVRGGGEKPVISVMLRGEIPEPTDPEGDLGPISFVLELNSPNVLYATPSKGSWLVSEEGWETAMRFKYTSWFGLASRQDGKWSVDWQGYRRPMLPESVTKHDEETCALFADR